MKPITDLSQLDLNATYSYADYLQWRLSVAVELIKGKVLKMSPAPNVRHQRISGRIFQQIASALQNKTCEVFAAPFDVRLYDSVKSQKENRKIFTVVQPDLCVLCKPEEQLDEQGAIGAPDLIIEILSPGNSKREMKTKYALYEEAGVKEYWVVYPYENAVLQFVLNSEGKYKFHTSFHEDENITSATLPDLEIDLALVLA